MKAVFTLLIMSWVLQAGVLGIGAADMGDALKSYYHRNSGVVVVSVKPGSPADLAGLKRGDLIVRYAKEDVENIAGFKGLLERPVSGTVRIEFYRDKIFKYADILPAPAIPAWSGPVMTFEGLTLEEVAEETIPFHGLRVVSVEPETSAAQVGIREGDWITQVGETPVTSLAVFEKATKKATKAISLWVYRDGYLIEKVIHANQPK